MTDTKEFARAVYAGNTDKVSQLLSGAMAKIDTPLGTAETTALHHAAGHGMLALARVLLERGANPNARDATGATPLHWAAVMDRGDLVKLLIEKSAEVDARTKRDETPLHRAARVGRVSAVRFLIEQGADCAAKNADDLTPFELARASELDIAVKEELLPLLAEGGSSSKGKPSGSASLRARGSKKSSSRKRN